MAEPERPEPNEAERNRREQRAMWIFSGAIVLLILVGMGANMMFHRDTAAPTDTDLSAQSRSAPSQQ